MTGRTIGFTLALTGGMLFHFFPKTVPCSQAQIVTLYSEANYNSRGPQRPWWRSQLIFVPGFYDMFEPPAGAPPLKLGNDKLSSVKVAAGFRVTCYEDAGFAARYRRYASDVPGVEGPFNDKTSSVLVEALLPEPPEGPYVVLFDEVDNKGRWQMFPPGEWELKLVPPPVPPNGSVPIAPPVVPPPTLDNDELSSLRVPAGWKVTLFEHEHLQGESRPYTTSQRSIGDFNDRASSIKVELIEAPPAVVIFRDADFLGPWQSMGPHSYDTGELSFGDDQISSLWVPPGWKVTLYEDPGFSVSGRSKSFLENDRYVGNDFNDITSSVVVESPLPPGIGGLGQPCAPNGRCAPSLECQGGLCLPAGTIREAPYEVALREFLSRRSRNGYFDEAAYRRGIERMRLLPEGKPRQIGLGNSPGTQELALSIPADARWEPIGPWNLDAPYQLFFGPGPVSGRVNAVAYASHRIRSDLRPDVLLVGSAAGGVWRSLDAGRNWEPLSDQWVMQDGIRSPVWRDLHVSALTVAKARRRPGAPWPQDEHVIYAGLGDFHGGLPAAASGVMKSTDGGSTWTEMPISPWKVTLYENGGFQGRDKSFLGDASYVGDGFDDQTSSIMVEGPPVAAIIFKDRDFAGSWQSLGPGSFDVTQLTIGDDQLSSLRVAPGWKVTLYELAGFSVSGRSKSFTDDAAYLCDDFDDQTSSIVVDGPLPPRGPVIIYKDRDFGGACQALGPGRYDVGDLTAGIGDEHLSSLRIPPGWRGAVSHILVDPGDPDLLIVTTEDMVWRSTDGGGHWNVAVATPAKWTGAAIGARHADGHRAYYVSGISSVGGGAIICRSTDEGLTWHRMTAPTGVLEVSFAIAASPSEPDNVYGLLGGSHTLFRSTDGGRTWTNITAGFPDAAGYNWWNSSYDYCIACTHRNGGDVLLVGLIDIAMSPNGGDDWFSIGGPTYTPSAETHNDQHAIAINPFDASEFLLGNDGGVYRGRLVDSPPPSAQFESLNRTLGITMFKTAAFDPTNPSIMLGGTQDNATPVSTGNLENWESRGVGDGGGVAINPRNPNLQYATTYADTLKGPRPDGLGRLGRIPIYRTETGWWPVAPPGSGLPAPSMSVDALIGDDSPPFVPAIELDPQDPLTVYTGTQFLYRMQDQLTPWDQGPLWPWGQAPPKPVPWSRVSGQEIGTRGGWVTHIAVAPSDGNIIYAVAGSRLMATFDRGANWKQLLPSNAPPGPCGGNTINVVSIHPTDPNDILVGFNDGLWRCTGAETSPIWADASGSGVPKALQSAVLAVVRDPDRPGRTFFVGMDAGVFMTEDAGATWSNIGTALGLPLVSVEELDFPGTGFLNAATYGRGMWRLRLAP